jgi:hypothetical protein
MNLNKKIILIIILLILILYFYINKQNRIKEKMGDLEQSEKNKIMDLLNNFNNIKNLEDTINNNIVNNIKHCVNDEDEYCIDNILNLQNDYIINNKYNFDNLSMQNINTKKLCIKDKCIDDSMINKYVKYVIYNQKDNTDEYYLFNINETIIYPQIEHNDLSGNTDTIIDIINPTYEITLQYNNTTYYNRLFDTYIRGPAAMSSISPNALITYPNITQNTGSTIGDLKYTYTQFNGFNNCTSSTYTENSLYAKIKSIFVFPKTIYNRNEIDYVPNNNSCPSFFDTSIIQKKIIYDYATPITFKIPFHDKNSKYGYKLTSQNRNFANARFRFFASDFIDSFITNRNLMTSPRDIYIDPEMMGFKIKIPYDNTNINYNVLWINVPNYCFSTFKLSLYDSSTKTILKRYGTFGAGLRFKNRFNDRINLYNINLATENYFDWVPISIYGNDNTNKNQYLILNVDRPHSNGQKDDVRDISGFILTGIGFSTNPNNFCRINPSALYYNDQNQTSDKFQNNQFAFGSNQNLSLNFNKNLAANIYAIKTVRSTDISGLIINTITGTYQSFSIQILPPKPNNYKVLYLIGASYADLNILNILTISLAINPNNEKVFDKLINLSAYPPYSLTSTSNLMGVIIDPAEYTFGEYFNVLKIIFPSGVKSINILEIGSFDLNKDTYNRINSTE